jgi:ABC-2 type transport system ATP-binding protein
LACRGSSLLQRHPYQTSSSSRSSRNGAGKTTAVDLVLGLRRPDAGDVRVFGMDPRVPASRLQVGATPQESMFPGTLRVRELATFAAAHFADHEPVGDHLERFGLASLAPRQVGGLSPGERRRLALALAFVGHPRLVVLDEPTTGLDVGSRRTAWDAVRAHSRRGGTVLLTTHSLEEVEALASRIAVLSQGRIVATGTSETLVAEVALKRVRFRAWSVPELPAVERAIHERGVWELTTRDAEGTVARLVEAGVRREEIEIAPARLEDAFLALTERSEE